MSETVSANGVKEKVERVISDNQRLRSELSRLEKERDRLASKASEAESKVAEIQRRLDVMEMSGALASSGGDNKKAQLRINRLLREIDKCMALMNR